MFVGKCDREVAMDVSSVVVGIPTLSRYDLLEQCVQGFLRGTVRPDVFVIIDNGRRFPLTLISDVRSEVELLVYTPKENLGVAKSWNTIYELTHVPQTFIVNDDIVPEPTLIAELLEAQTQVKRNSLLYPKCHPDHIFSCYLMAYDTWETVGRFDEGYVDGYWEDRDFADRAIDQGVLFHEVPSVTYTHEGSATLKAGNELWQMRHVQTFTKNRLRYEGKKRERERSS